MSLSLEKARQRSRKKAPAKASTKTAARSRPWNKPASEPAKPVSLSNLLAQEGQNRISQLKSQLTRPRTLKWKGVELEISARPRLHLPALKRRKG